MKLRHGLALASLLSLASTLWAADPPVVLSLKTKMDGKVVSTVEFFNCQKDPNTNTANCAQYVTVDGKQADVPAHVLSRLDNLRASFSYDSQSGGIQKLPEPTMRCLLGGPSSGVTLEARYVTYKNSILAGDEMKPVFDMAHNCLFMETYSPTLAKAREGARAAVEILETIRDYAQRAR